MSKEAKRNVEARFLVGYDLDRGVVWGRQGFKELVGSEDERCENYADLMTKADARIARKAMPAAGAKIFELVEVKP